MAGKFPYVASSGPLVKTIQHLRKSFPKEVTAETLRKLGVAPKNESYVINVLRFLDVITEEGSKNEPKAKVFLNHQEEAFAKELETLVRAAYEELFELHGDGAWRLDRGTLTQFFRTTDHTSDVVGSRQAGTFMALAALSGHGDVPEPKAAREGVTKKANAKPRKEPPPKAATKEEPIKDAGGGPREVGLTVRIKVNLPANGDQDTYDRIFKSIRKNLLSGG